MLHLKIGLARNFFTTLLFSSLVGIEGLCAAPPKTYLAKEIDQRNRVQPLACQEKPQESLLPLLTNGLMMLMVDEDFTRDSDFPKPTSTKQENLSSQTQDVVSSTSSVKQPPITKLSPDVTQRLCKDTDLKFSDLSLGGLKINDKGWLEVSAALSPMPHVEKLDISQNDITRLDNLDHLVYLRSLFAPSNLINLVPILSPVKNLQALSLSHNQLHSFPDLENLTNLRILFLSGNKLTALPGLEKLKNLRILFLDDNAFTKIAEVSALSDLKVISLSHNALTSLPSFRGLPQLTRMFLRNNQLSALPEADELPNLQVLDTSRNPLLSPQKIEKLRKALPNCRFTNL